MRNINRGITHIGYGHYVGSVKLIIFADGDVNSILLKKTAHSNPMATLFAIIDGGMSA